MLRGIYGDPERYVQQYWAEYPGIYFTGDGARRDEDGYFWLLGRVDDVMNVSGHRVSHHGGRVARWSTTAGGRGRRHRPARTRSRARRIAAFVTIKDGVDGDERS